MYWGDDLSTVTDSPKGFSARSCLSRLANPFGKWAAAISLQTMVHVQCNYLYPTTPLALPIVSRDVFVSHLRRMIAL